MTPVPVNPVPDAVAAEPVNGRTPVLIGSRDAPFDLLGVGFGPSNLALAIAAAEIAPRRRCLFLERNDGVYWHHGLLLEGARMQISFLKDLVSLRNPASAYTFLQYLKAKGRLERFVNLDVARPTRLEYQDYLTWVAGHFGDTVRYGSEVVRIEPVPSRSAGVLDLLRVTARDAGGRSHDYYAHNVVHAAGGRARPVPGGDGCDAVIHSSKFLPRFPRRFARAEHPYEFAVAGDGQSAAEIVRYLLTHYPDARVHLVLYGCALRATDNNPFVNEFFQRSNADRFHASDPARRAAVLAQLRTTNYGVVEPGFLQELYELTYADEVRGRQRLVVHGGAEVSCLDAAGVRPSVTVRDRIDGSEQVLECDGVVLATGYTRALDPDVYGPVLPLLRRDAAGQLSVSADYRVETAPELTAGLYLQGFAEQLFGLGDTLLSLLPFRSEQIITDIGRRAGGPRRPAAAGPHRSGTPGYPPTPYLEQDAEKVYALMQRFNFASVLSADPGGEVLVTHLPLVLDRSGAGRGILLGHLDRANPQVPLLAAGRATVIFHGPNAFLSPHAVDTDPLPTWNSMAVHVRGRTRLFTGRQALLGVFDRLCEDADPDPGGYRLHPDDKRIERLIDHVLGLEILIEELVGRFKLSQDLGAGSRRLAAGDMVRAVQVDQQPFLKWMFGVDGPGPHRSPHNGATLDGSAAAAAAGLTEFAR